VNYLTLKEVYLSK